MVGTFINGAAIVTGGVVGLVSRKNPSPETQAFLRVGLGVLTVYLGLQLVWRSVHGNAGQVLKQLGIAVLALALGRLIGKLLRLQKMSNAIGQRAKKRIEESTKLPPGTANPNDGFVICASLFCAAPLAFLGAMQDGLNGYFGPLLIKSVMDGLAALAFVSVFKWGPILSAIPVMAYQGAVTLGAAALLGFLRDRALLDSVNMTSGLLIFTVALVILELKKIEIADYLPSVAIAPLLTFWWS